MLNHGSKNMHQVSYSQYDKNESKAPMYPTDSSHERLGHVK